MRRFKQKTLESKIGQAQSIQTIFQLRQKPETRPHSIIPVKVTFSKLHVDECGAHYRIRRHTGMIVLYPDGFSCSEAQTETVLNCVNKVFLFAVYGGIAEYKVVFTADTLAGNGSNLPSGLVKA